MIDSIKEERGEVRTEALTLLELLRRDVILEKGGMVG